MQFDSGQLYEDHITERKLGHSEATKIWLASAVNQKWAGSANSYSKNVLSPLWSIDLQGKTGKGNVNM